MGFKLVKVEKKVTTGIDDESFISFLLEDHNNKVFKRSPDLLVDDDSIPSGLSESKKEFDFFWDENKESARKDVIRDLEASIIKIPVIQKEEQVVDRRKSKRK
jgi:hypothetical protein